MSATNLESSRSTPTNAQDGFAEKLHALRTLVVDCPELRELEIRLGKFNIFDVLKSAHNEIRHSNFLAWILDPKGSHGMNDLFLRRWLMRVFHDSEQEGASYLDPVEVDTTPFRSVGVRREWNRVDVLLEIETQAGEQWIICIENKVWSSQGAGQLSAYRNRVEHAFPNAAHRVYIFLTVLQEQPDDAFYVVATYRQVRWVLQTCLAEHEGSLGQGPRLLVEHYLSILTERFMENSEVINLARQIYASHRVALDTIFEHRPDNLLFLTEELERRVKGDPKRLVKHKYTGKGWIGFVPLHWEVTENKISETWSTVLCEIKLTSDKFRLKAFVDPSAPLAWREKLYELAQEHSFPNTTKKKKVPGGGFTFYKIVGNELKLGEAEESDISEIAENVWKWASDVVLSKQFTSMVSIVAEHLKTLQKPAGTAT